MYVCVCVCIFVCVYVCIFVSQYVCVNVYLYMHVYGCVCVCVCVTTWKVGFSNTSFVLIQSASVQTKEPFRTLEMLACFASKACG